MMPYSNKGEREKRRRKEIRFLYRIFGNYRNIVTLRSGGFNVPTHESPDGVATLRRGYALGPRGALYHSSLHYDTLPLNPSTGATVSITMYHL